MLVRCSAGLNIFLKNCYDPGLNQGLSDLQSDALPTELSQQSYHNKIGRFSYVSV